MMKDPGGGKRLDASLIDFSFSFECTLDLIKASLGIITTLQAKNNKAFNKALICYFDLEEETPKICEENRSLSGRSAEQKGLF